VTNVALRHEQLGGELISFDFFPNGSTRRLLIAKSDLVSTVGVWSEIPMNKEVAQLMRDRKPLPHGSVIRIDDNGPA